MHFIVECVYCVFWTFQAGKFWYVTGVQASYWGMLEEGRIRQTTAILLMQSVDEAIDMVIDKPLCDWRGLKAHVHFPNYYKFLQVSYCPPKLVTYFTVERLESACYICAAFLRAHRIARRQLHEFIGIRFLCNLQNVTVLFAGPLFCFFDLGNKCISRLS